MYISALIIVPKHDSEMHEFVREQKEKKLDENTKHKLG